MLTICLDLVMMGLMIIVICDTKNQDHYREVGINF